MITAVILFLAKPLMKIFKIDATKAQKIVWIIVAIVAFIIIAVVFNRACNWLTRAKVTTPQEVQKINDADEKTRKQELQKKVEEYADAITTADNTMTIAETNVVERNRKIEEKIKVVDEKINQIKQEEHRDVTSDELECMLTGNC